MKSKEEIVENWLPRYTSVPLDEFGEYILLTNFTNYLRMFAEESARANLAEESLRNERDLQKWYGLKSSRALPGPCSTHRYHHAFRNTADEHLHQLGGQSR